MAKSNTPLFDGFAMYHPETKEQLLSAEQVRRMVRLELPADLSPGMAPTLLPGDRVVITPTTVEQSADNALLYVRLHEPLDGYKIGRLITQNNDDLILTDEKRSELIRIKRGNVADVWAVNHIVFRSLAPIAGKGVCGE